MGNGIKIFWPGLFITSPDHLEEKLAIEKDELNKNYRTTKKLHTNHQNGPNSNSTTLKNMFFNNLSVSKLYITTGKLHYMTCSLLD